VVEPKLYFFKVQAEGAMRHLLELHQVAFGIIPKGFNAINMLVTVRKLIVSVVASKALCITSVNKSIITSPAIGVDDAINSRYPPAKPGGFLSY